MDAAALPPIDEPHLYSSASRLAAGGALPLLSSLLSRAAAQPGGAARLADGDVEGMPPLCSACRAGEEGAVRALLEAAGEDREAGAHEAIDALRGPAHSTPAMLACDAASAGCLAELLLRGVDLALRDNAGNTALHRACRAGATPLLPLLVEPSAALRARADAARRPLAASAVSRISSAVLVEATNEAGRTALHVAANGGHAACVAFLLAHRADASAADDRLGWTPLHVASAAGHELVCSLLLGAGSDADAADRRGRVPRQLAEGIKAVEAAFAVAAAAAAGRAGAGASAAEPTEVA